MNVINIDDQPISATFFGEGRWLTEFVTPGSLEVKQKYDELTEGLYSVEDKIEACWRWVASQIKYVEFIKARLQINGLSFTQNDLWMDPSLTIQTKVGNCANKSFLLTSLLRNALPSNAIHCVLGNLYNGEPGGHAWVEVSLGGRSFICESTRSDVPVLVPAEAAARYEAVHFFNDEEAFAVEGLTVMEPFSRCYSTWLKDYLDWVYINEQRGRA